MGNHAILSASSSHRWMNCPPSERLTEHRSDSGSVYATEGSEAHALCEYKLRQVLGQDAQNPLESPGGLQYYNNAMKDAATGLCWRSWRKAGGQAAIRSSWSSIGSTSPAG